MTIKGKILKGPRIYSKIDSLSKRYRIFKIKTLKKVIYLNKFKNFLKGRIW